MSGMEKKSKSSYTNRRGTSKMGPTSRCDVAADGQVVRIMSDTKYKSVSTVRSPYIPLEGKRHPYKTAGVTASHTVDEARPTLSKNHAQTLWEYDIPTSSRT